MPELTRRPHPERSDCWHVYYGDVQVGTIAVQSGLPVHAKQWRWDIGFYPASHRGHNRSGYAASFDEARAGLEAAWKAYLPKCTKADFNEFRRQRAWTARNAMREPAAATHHRVRGPTQKSSSLPLNFFLV